jgi:hypothetical protein
MAKKRKNIFKTKTLEPKWDDVDKLTGDQYSRRLHACSRALQDGFYKQDVYKKWILEYCKSAEKWKEHFKTIAKNPDREFRPTLAGLCRLSICRMS